jgi:hypothetical protein
MAVTTGIREALMFAENQGKLVTIAVGSTAFSGKVLRVSPLVIESAETGLATVVNFDSVVAVTVQGTDSQTIVNAVKPQAESRFTGERKL